MQYPMQRGGFPGGGFPGGGYPGQRQSPVMSAAMAAQQGRRPQVGVAGCGGDYGQFGPYPPQQLYNYQQPWPGQEQMGQAPMTNCGPGYYPIVNGCDDLVMPPVNPCDPFSIFCSLFGTRRGLKKTAVGFQSPPIVAGVGGVPANSTLPITIPTGLYFRPCSIRFGSDGINGSLFFNMTSGGVPQFGGNIGLRLGSEVAMECIPLSGDASGGFGGALVVNVINQSGSPANVSGMVIGTEFTC